MAMMSRALRLCRLMCGKACLTGKEDICNHREAMPRDERRSLTGSRNATIGKPEAFRTSGGKAADLARRVLIALVTFRSSVTQPFLLAFVPARD